MRQRFFFLLVFAIISLFPLENALADCTSVNGTTENCDYGTQMPTIAWSITGGETTCDLTNTYPSFTNIWSEWSGEATTATGTKSFTNMNINANPGTYTFVCTLDGGTISSFATLNVAPAKPTGLTHSCNAAGNQVTLSWGASTNALNYAVRVDDRSTPAGTCPASWPDDWYCPTIPASKDFLDNSYNGTSVTLPVTPGQSHWWWVHGRNGGYWSHPEGAGFTCNPTTYTVTPSISATSPVGSGSISPSMPTAYAPGSSPVVTMTANSGYIISGIRVKNCAACVWQAFGPTTDFIFNNISSDMWIEVAFEAIGTYTVATSAGTGCTITPSSPTVNHGDRPTFTIAAQTNYTLTDVVDTGTSVGTPTTYVMSAVTTSNRTLTATCTITTPTAVLTAPDTVFVNDFFSMTATSTNASSCQVQRRINLGPYGLWSDLGSTYTWNNLQEPIAGVVEFQMICYSGPGNTGVPSVPFVKTITVTAPLATFNALPNSCVINPGWRACRPTLSWTSAGTNGGVTLTDAWNGYYNNYPEGSQSGMVYTPFNLGQYHLLNGRYNSQAEVNTAIANDSTKVISLVKTVTSSCGGGSNWDPTSLILPDTTTFPGRCVCPPGQVIDPSGTTCVHTVTPSAGTGCTITPNTVQYVVPGNNSPQFTISAQPGYTVTSVTDNGSPVRTTAGDYINSSVTENRTIVATCTATPTLNICPSSATTTGGGTRSFTAYYNASDLFSGCSSPNGTDVTGDAGTNWSSDNTAVAVSLGAGVFQGQNVGGTLSTTIRVNYSGLETTAPLTVTCNPVDPCTPAAVGAECDGTSFDLIDNCGYVRSCTGTRSCNYNWKEVAP